MRASYGDQISSSSALHLVDGRFAGLVDRSSSCNRLITSNQIGMNVVQALAMEPKANVTLQKVN